MTILYSLLIMLAFVHLCIGPYIIIETASYGRPPRWWFKLVCAWWWPFRKESAATLLYTAVGCMDDATLLKHFKEKLTYGDHGGWTSELLHCHFRTNRSGKAELTINNQQVRNISVWDDYLLSKLARRLVRVNKRKKRLEELRQSAETMRDAAVTMKAALEELHKQPEPSPTQRIYEGSVKAATNKRKAMNDYTTFVVSERTDLR